MSVRLPGPLVSTEWLSDHLGQDGLVVVEVDEQPLMYTVGHVEGARNVDWRTELQDPLTRDIPDGTAIAELWRRLGIGRSTAVVMYGDKNNWYAAFGLWLFRYWGLSRVALLDGGRQAWLAEDRPITRDTPAAAHPVRVPKPQPDPSMRARWSDVLGAGDALALVDVRTPAEYRGDVLAEPGYEAEGAQRAGHIPGAANVPWDVASAPDGRFLPLDRLTAIYAAHDIGPERPVISYCRIGERSAHTWFVLHELLGHPDVRNYDGSWTEWGSMIGMPIAVGEHPGDLPGPRRAA